jgi:hypothetical protein
VRRLGARLRAGLALLQAPPVRHVPEEPIA